MISFQLLSRSRQATEYTCGPSALQAVLRFWGKDVAEEKLADLMGTTEAVGTYPENIVKGAQALGLDASVISQLTLDEVQTITANGKPMIALAQVWLSGKNSKSSVDREWNCGHYIVVVGVDEENVYFQDPYVLMSKAFVPRKTFEAHWHHAMSGDPKTSPVLSHLGIVIEGRKGKRKSPRPARARMPARDLDRMGSLQLIVIEFKGALFPYDLMKELNEAWSSGEVRANAFVVMRKDKFGRLSAIQGGSVRDDNDVAASNAIFAALAHRSLRAKATSSSSFDAALKAASRGDFGLPLSDIQALAKSLTPNHSAVAVLIENVWERGLRATASKRGGVVTRQELISLANLTSSSKRASRGSTRKQQGRGS